MPAPYPLYGSSMILTSPGTWSINHWKGSAAFANGLEILSPFYQLITPAAVPGPPGTTYTIPAFNDGDALILQLVGDRPPGRRSDSAFAYFRAESTNGVEWFIDWEDWELTGSVADWDDSHTHIFQTIEQAIYVPQIYRWPIA